jgi:hypothetical protein
MVVVEGVAARHISSTGDPVVRPLPHPSLCKVHIVEVGYTVDTRYEEKYQRKSLQHAALVAKLRNNGWDVRQHVILLGSGGAVFRTAVNSLQNLGIRGDDLDKCISKLLVHTANAAQSIVTARRRLEGGVLRTGVG